MNAVKPLVCALALSMIAGCAGTGGLSKNGAVSTTAKTLKPPVIAQKKPEKTASKPEKAASKPESVEQKAAKTPAPKTTIERAPARVAVPPTVVHRPAPQPQYQHVTLAPAAPAKPAPRYVPLPQPQITAKIRRPAPSAPQFDDLGAYDRLASLKAKPAPAPKREMRPMQLARVAPFEPTPAPFERAPKPSYEQIGSLDAAPRRPARQFAPSLLPAAPPAYVAAAPAITAPVQAAPKRRSMAPIRDDPRDSGPRLSEAKKHARKAYRRGEAAKASAPRTRVRTAYTPDFGRELETAALQRLNPGIRYDGRYVKIGYPWGDVHESTGVCTDVVIRSYRGLGIDLQQLVHEDMRMAFNAYPSKRIYGLKSADSNIDHRRVVNLEAFFERTGAAIPVGSKPDDFQPGDLVTWRLSGNEPHIGIVVAERDPRSGYPLIVHNLGAGVRKEDLLSLDRPVGHFRFAPDRNTRFAMLQSQRTGQGG